MYFRCLRFQEGSSNTSQSITIGFLPHRNERNDMYICRMGSSDIGLEKL